MALLEALTYEIWILFKTTHFGCAFGLLERHRPQVYVSWQMNLLFTYVVKSFLCNTVWSYPLPHRIQHTVQSLIQNLCHHLNANQIKFPLWEFEFTLTRRLLASEEKTLQCPTLPTQPWLLHCPEINYSLHSLHKDDTAPEIFRHNFNELCADYSYFTPIYTNGSRMGDGVASAVVWQKSCKTVRLPSNASIFRAELYAISLALNIIRYCRDQDFIIFSDSMSRFKL